MAAEYTLEGVKTIPELLAPLAPVGEVINERMIRLDLTSDQLRTALAAGRLGVGGAHSPTVSETLYGPNAIVPDQPQRLGLEHYGLMRPLLARPDTPDSLRIGFGATPAEIDIGKALAEAAAEGFSPASTSQYQLGPYGTGWLLDVMHNHPGEITTVIPRSDISHVSPETDTNRYVGIHYDQQPMRPDGWVERLPASSRIKAGRRIVVNIGDGRRAAIAALNFSALQFIDMFAPGDPGYLPRTGDLLAFMSAHPHLLATIVVLHVFIEAGEVAEIAAANSAHDGGMFGCDQESTCIVFSMGRSPQRSLTVSDPAGPR